MTAHAEYRAQMSTSDINDLPDDAFALVQPGGTKDKSGKTVPRSLRKFPVHDAPHTRNALSRLPQSDLSDADKAKAKGKIDAAARKFGIHAGDSDDSSGGRAWQAVDPERRNTPGLVEIRSAAEGRKIGGYGAVFGKLSRNLGGFVELVDNGAFNQSKNSGWPNIVARYNHNPDFVLGTTAGNTLQLRTDRMGLDYEVLPPQSRHDILELVERGDVRYSSFAFRVPPGGDEWRTTDQNYPMRTLHEVELVDVAPVLDPAYIDTSAGLRSLAQAMDAPLEEVRVMAAEDELRRFFVRSDRPSVLKPKVPKMSAAAAMMQLMEKRRDPWADQG